MTHLRYIPWGWTPHTKYLRCERSKSICFVGQKTHLRRIECVKAIESIPDAVVVTSDGFGKGVSHEDYCRILCSSKLVACPSGPLTVDSFRVCEALECGAIPILDSESPIGAYPFYWERVFGDHPLPVIYDWKRLPGIVELLLNTWAKDSLTYQNWWKEKKRQWVEQLLEDVYA